MKTFVVRLAAVVLRLLGVIFLLSCALLAVLMWPFTAIQHWVEDKVRSEYL